MSSFVPHDPPRADLSTDSATADIAVIAQMLRMKRPDSTAMEEAWVEKFILPHIEKVDSAGNHIIRIGDAPILWSCHTDTVHHAPGLQAVSLSDYALFADDSDCLGADDGAGVWLMLEMIKAKVEGLYIFHRGEECGGVGSRHIASNGKSLLDGIKFAIAFDRKGYDSVITHQGNRCCSEAFANSLASILGKPFCPDDTGLFTDTANYDHIIPECSNISVGYHQAHSKNEWVDVGFLIHLRDKLITADFSHLVCERDPNVRDDGWANWRDEDFDWKPSTHENLDERHYGRKPTTMCEFVEDNPDLIADLLESFGYNLADLERHADEVYK